MKEWAGVKDFLDEKVVQYNQSNFIETDPIQVPRRFAEKSDIEISAFLTATLAWGSRPAIIKSALKLISFMDDEPFRYVMDSSVSEQNRLKQFVHRTFNGYDCQYFILSLRNIYQKYGGLQPVFEQGFRQGNSVKSSLEQFYPVFFELKGERTRKHIANVSKGASAKRLNMFLRWMVRHDKNRVDFGLWQGIPASALMLPLDVHSGNVARKLGLFSRRQNDWKAVEEVSETLRKFDPDDPVKYDFALFGLGVFERF
jgi:uncharacterized protein (TIGR02757 family)